MVEYQTHAWNFKPLSALTSDELKKAKAEVEAQRRAIHETIMEPIKIQAKLDLEQKQRLDVITERAKEVAISAEQQAKNMHDFNVYMKKRAEETEEWAKGVTENPLVGLVTAPAKALSGVGDALGDVGVGFSGAVGGIGDGIGGVLGGVQTGLAGIGVFVMVIVVVIIIALVLGRGF